MPFSLEEEDLKAILMDLAKFLCDTKAVVLGLQAAAQIRQAKRDEIAVLPELEAAERMLYSPSLLISLERNHNMVCDMVETIAKEMAAPPESADEDLQLEPTRLIPEN